ncbi:MAG TPA: DEAD/DEAH box helicase [Gemmatimonadaceae bacterium]
MQSADRRLVYVIDAPASWRGVAMVVELATERLRRDGGWEELTLMPESAFELRGAAIEGTLRRACDSGRCRVRRAEDEAPSEPLRWDEGGAWQFRLCVSREDHDQYEITGAFHRGHEKIAMADLAMLHWECILIADGMISHFDDSGSYAVVALFRNVGKLVMNREELAEFITSFDTLPATPPVDLPHGSPIIEVHAPPVPTLKVMPATDWDRKRRRLITGFQYGPIHINGDERSPVLYAAGTNAVHYRDFAEEANARARLAAHGARQEYDPDVGEPILVVPSHKLAGLVAESVRSGWRVDAAGTVYRTAGPTRAVVRSGIDWFELDASVRYGDVEVGLRELLEARRSGATSILLPDGTHGVLPLEWLARLAPLTAGGKIVGGVMRYRQSQVALLDALLDAVPEADVDATFERARSALHTFETIAPIDPGPDFVGELREYQREGVGWLSFLRHFGLGGCLADDMGLGKTVQVLAMLDARREIKDRPATVSLVVVPRSLIFNWLREAQRFTPRVRMLDFTGTNRQTTDINPDAIDVVVTTYGTLRRDAAQLADMRFDYVILDEAQAIKNPASASAKAARLLNAEHRLAITGTPIENRLEELWSLFEFLNPGMLGSASGFAELVRLADIEDPTEPSETGGGRDLLARALRPVVLRRTKEQVARDLPARTEQTLGVDLDPAQRTFYDGLLQSYRQSVLERVDTVGVNAARMHILEALLRLRQAACHPGLVDPKLMNTPSAKLDALVPRLEEIAAQGHKALVFSQFTSFLAIARDRLDAAGISYEYLDGRTRDRQERVDRFQNDPSVPLFLISLKAGGHGLNLTAADYVYLLDPWWNPAVEAQAIDRAHRIGQTRNVIATRLVARGTVEEKILELQASKRALADAILGQDQGLLSQIGRDELEMLLG